MHMNGETWLRILLPLFGLIVSSSCLRGSELVLLAAKKQVDKATNVTQADGEVSDAAGSSNSTTGEKSLLTGIPQLDYIHDPNLPRELNGFNLSDYPFYNSVPPDIDFKCDGLHDGFYASVPHHCQVYHHCLYGIRYDFLCANYTAFDQKTFICHFVSEVDCNNSPKYYQRNEALYKQTTSAPVIIKTTKATTTTTEAPKKAEEDSRRPGPYRPRRPPFRRRPSYEYYDNTEDYYDDYYYYEPPVRKRPNRKGYRGDPYYGGERAGGHKSIHRDPPRRKPLKPLYEDDEEYEYYYDTADASKDDDDRRRPLDNNYRKPADRERPYLNKKRDKDLYNRDRNDKKKRTEEDYINPRKSEDDKRLRNKYKGLANRSKYDRDEEELDDFENPRRYQDDKRDKYLKNKSSESSKRAENDKPFRPKLGPKSTTPYSEEEDYEDIAATPKWKTRFQQRRPAKEDSKKYQNYDDEESSPRKPQNSDKPKEPVKEKSQEVTEAGVIAFNPQLYTRKPSKLYSQVKVETRPPQVQRNKDLYKADVPATTMSSNRRPPNTRAGPKDKTSEPERRKPGPKYTTTSAPDIEYYDDDDSLVEDTYSSKSYYGDDVSEAYLMEQFPSKSSPTTQKPEKNKEQIQDEIQPKIASRNKPVLSSFSQRFKPVTERPSNTYAKEISTTEKTTTKSPVTQSQYLSYSFSSLDESKPSYTRQQVTEKQPLSSLKPASERLPQTIYQRQQQYSETPLVQRPYVNSQIEAERQPQAERQPYNERQSQAERQAYTERQPQAERQSYNERQPQPERQAYTERQPQAERQSYNERQPQSERQAYTERQPFIPQAERQTERQIYTERQPYLDRQQQTEKQLYPERQTYVERQPYIERQPYVERQPLSYSKQPVTERLIPYPKQPVTDRQVFTYVKQPVTDRQLIPFKQIVTERQIIPYLRQSEVERRPSPFPKQPPRTFEITAPGPSALGGRIEVSDTIQRDKYVIHQGDRPTGFSVRLPQSDFSNLQTSTQIQRRPEEPEKVVTRPPFKPVRTYRSKPTAEPQYHDNVRLETFPQRYLTRTEGYDPVVVQNPRLPILPPISQVSNTKEWYW